MLNFLLYKLTDNENEDLYNVSNVSYLNFFQHILYIVKTQRF